MKEKIQTSQNKCICFCLQLYIIVYISQKKFKIINWFRKKELVNIAYVKSLVCDNQTLWIIILFINSSMLPKIVSLVLHEKLFILAQWSLVKPFLRSPLNIEYPAQQPFLLRSGFYVSISIGFILGFTVATWVII